MSRIPGRLGTLMEMGGEMSLAIWTRTSRNILLLGLTLAIEVTLRLPCLMYDKKEDEKPIQNRGWFK